jgi:hypothetical protein
MDDVVKRLASHLRRNKKSKDVVGGIFQACPPVAEQDIIATEQRRYSARIFVECKTLNLTLQLEYSCQELSDTVAPSPGTNHIRRKTSGNLHSKAVKVWKTGKSFALLGRTHSWRSAISGSTLVALRAGIQQANNATTNNSSEIPTNVKGSVGLMP